MALDARNSTKSFHYQPGDIKMPLLEDGLTEGEVTHDMGKGGFEYIFAIRLPTAVKASETEKFKKYMAKVYPGQSPEEVIKSFILDPVCRQNSSISCAGYEPEDELKAALNCTIGMLLSFFDTLGNSHGQHIKIFKFNSIEVNKIFICTRMGTELAETLADMAEYPVQLSAEGIEKLNIKISDKTDLMPAYVKYDEKFQKEGLIHHVSRSKGQDGGEGSILRHIDKIRLLYDKLTDYVEIGNLEKLYQPLNITFKMYLGHDEILVDHLRKDWASFKHIFDWNQPIQEIRNYFGEAVAFYFMFDNFMRQSLLILFILCCPLYYWFANEDDPELAAWVDAIYSFMIMIWYTVTIKLWRRHEAYYANYWGSDYEYSGTTVKHRVNPNFVGDVQPKFYDEKILAMAPDENKRRKGIIQSVCVTASYILLGTICVSLNRLFATDIHFIRPYASTLLALQIKIFDLFWQKIGPWLASHEEHTELLALVQSQSLKYSIFLTFNTFQGFIWIAYVQPHIANEACKHAPQCFRVLLRESISQSFPILILFSGLGMAFPFYQIWQKYKKQAKDLKELEAKNKDEGFKFYQISSFEEQTKKMEYTGEDAMYDYTQVLSSVSFVALFGSVNPLPIVGLAWLAISVQHRVDAIRLCVLYQRTYPDKIANIGVWDKMLSFLRYACVCNIIGLLSTNPRVNLAVLLNILPASVSHMAHRNENETTIEQTHNLTLDEVQTVSADSERLLWLANQFAVVLILFVMMFILWLSDKVIADETPIVTREKARQLHQRAKLFDFENSEFSEDVKIKGTGNHKSDRYESVSKLEPDDERYVKPITMC